MRPIVSKKAQMLYGAAALQSFTADELADYVGVKPTTVKTYLLRERTFFDVIGKDETGRRGGEPKRYRLNDAARIHLREHFDQLGGHLTLAPGFVPMIDPTEEARERVDLAFEAAESSLRTTLATETPTGKVASFLDTATLRLEAAQSVLSATPALRGKPEFKSRLSDLRTALGHAGRPIVDQQVEDSEYYVMHPDGTAVGEPSSEYSGLYRQLVANHPSVQQGAERPVVQFDVPKTAFLFVDATINANWPNCLEQHLRDANAGALRIHIADAARDAQSINEIFSACTLLLQGSAPDPLLVVALQSDQSTSRRWADALLGTLNRVLFSVHPGFQWRERNVPRVAFVDEGLDAEFIQKDIENANYSYQGNVKTVADCEPVSQGLLRALHR
jgi:hypothetical protein